MEERPMKVILLAGAFAASTAFGAYAAAGTQLSQAECDSLWNQMNPANAPAVTESQAKPYVTDFKAANPDGDGSLDRNEFATACSNGLVKGSSSSGAASGDAGNKMAPAEKMAPAPSSKSPPSKGY
jgi:hypothetical protein